MPIDHALFSRLQLSPNLSARWIPAASRLDIDAGTRKVSLPVDAFRLALEFADGAIVDDVLSDLQGVPRAELEQLLGALLSEGILTRIDTVAPTVGSIRDVLRPELVTSASLGRIAHALDGGHAVVLDNAFVEPFADRVFAALQGTTSWRPYEGHDGLFHYRHHNLYDEASFPAALADCQRIFSSVATKSFLHDALRCTADGRVTFTASCYLPGDYSLPHTDNALDRDLAFVWNLTKDWRPEWGGSLFWCPTSTYVTPAFNRLTLFRVTNFSMHFVCPVSSLACGRRLCVNGWWCRKPLGSTEPGDAKTTVNTLVDPEGVAIL